MSGKPIDEAVMERVARAIAEVNGEDPAGWRYYQADAIVAIDILTAAQQQGQAVAEVVQEADGVNLRFVGPILPAGTKLYTAPPPSAPTQPEFRVGVDVTSDGAHVVVLRCEGDAGEVIYSEVHTLRAPPSAPVGGEGLIEAAKAAESMLRTVHECASHECEDCREYAGIVAKKLRAALAQQPAAVDEDVRELLDAMDSGADPRPAFLRLRQRFPALAAQHQEPKP